MTDPSPLPPHEYVSTACVHDLHEACRRECKFCTEPCRCPCHHPPRTPPTNGRRKHA